MKTPALRVTAAIAVLASLAALPATASAAAKPKVSLVRAADGVRIEVKLTSKRPFTKATKPRGVKVVAGGKTYKLQRAGGTRKSSTWRSRPQTGAAGTALEALGGQSVKVRIATRGKTKTVQRKVPALPPTTPGTPGTPGTPVTPPAPGGVQLTRDDATAQTTLAGAGDLLLEWAEFASVTAEYRRIWMLADGTFRLNIIDWNQVSGERCRESLTGTWAFKEGYTTTYNGGGVVIKVTLTLSNGQTGDDIVALSYADPSHVWVGAQLVEYSRNPHIMQSC